MFYILIPIIAGASIVISRCINANLAKKIGLFPGTFFNFLTGLIFSLIFLMVTGETKSFLTADFSSLPLWAYFGGIVGVLVVFLSNYITPRISAFYLTLLMFVAQLFTGIAIDYFISGIISPGKLIGGLLVLIGLSYNLVLDSPGRFKNQSEKIL